MSKVMAVAAVAVVALVPVGWAADGPAAAKPDPQHIEVTGKLRTGVMAIGGETTGIVLTVPDHGAYELDLHGDKQLRKTADELNGKQVKVGGTLAVKPGVEIKERRIIKVDTMVAAPEALRK